MKKMTFVVMAAIAIGFVSCSGNKAQQAPADVTEVVEEETTTAEDVEKAVSEVTAQLNEQIEAKDAGKLQEVIETVQTKVAEILKENPEAAKEYVAKVQEFLKENAEQIKAAVGNNAAIQSAISALTAAPADAIVSGLSSAVGAGEDAVDAAKEKASEKVEAAKEKAAEEINKAANDAAEKAKKALGI